MLKKIFKFWLPAFIWAGVIFLFSSLTVTPSDEFDIIDFIIKKTAHVVEYVIFFTLLYRALVNTARLTKTHSFVFALLLAVFYSVTDEYHQSFTPGRTPSLRDIGFDTIGGILAWIVLWKYLPKAPVRLKNWAEKLQII